MKNSAKRIVIPLNGNENELSSVNFLNFLYDSDPNLDVTLLHILPSLPSVLTNKETTNIDENIKIKVREVEKKSKELADRLLLEAKENLVMKGFNKAF